MTANFFRRLASFSSGIFQPALRAILLFTLGMLLTTTLQDAPNTLATSFFVALSCGAALLVLLGIAGRAGALIVVILLAWQPSSATLDPISAVALYCALFSAIGVLLLGCGRYSLWQGDDHWVNRQDGA